MANITIGEVLKQLGYISEEQLQAALEYQSRNRNKRVGEIVVELGFVTEEKKLEALSKRLTIPLINVDNTEFDGDAVKQIPHTVAIEHNIIAFAMDDTNTLSVITSDPLNMYGMEEVSQITGMPLRVYLAIRSDVDKVINYYYSEVNAKKVAEKANSLMQEVDPLQDLDFDLDLDQANDDTLIIQLVHSLVVRGYNAGASDIHIEPFDKKTDIRMRVDGTLVNYLELQTGIHLSIIARIKIMADLDIAERRSPQDGHYKTKINNENVNIRVSIIPTVFGEKAVLRILTSRNAVDHATTFGMSDENYGKISKILSSPNGIVYITGPTGSGKTTTLYMILEKLARDNINISTIEDPVEKTLANLNQMQVNNQAGVTFESGMRALLRQDPDVIMVGETRDSETADISVRAAITGHLVLSTLHTNDAISSVVRLRDMGVESYLIANSVVGLVAQRLVKKVCPHCATTRETTDREKLIMGENIETVKVAKGCSNCNNTGYSGRTSIHEIVIVDKELRELIANGASTGVLTDYCMNKQAMKTLKNCCVDLLRDGITTMDEFVKVSYYAD